MPQRHAPSGFKVKDRSRLEVRKEAMATKASILAIMGKKSIKDVVPSLLFEHLSELEIEYQIIDDNSDEIKKDIPAAMIGNVLLIRDHVYKGIVRQVPRDVFTLYHEIGHYILKHERELNRGQIGKHEYYEDSEWQANAFASEILMPIDEIKELLKKNPVLYWEDIYCNFCVSVQSAQYRYNKLLEEGIL